MSSRNNRGSATAEFSLSLFLVLFLFSFPLINLLSLAITSASLYLLVYQSVTRASTQEQYFDALSTLQQEALNFLQSGFAKLSRVQPQSGYKNCGLDLYIIATNFHNNTTQVYGPNISLSTAPDTLTNIYEFNAQEAYQVWPIVPLGSVPFIGQIPGVGQPVVLKISANRTLEHPNSLNIASSVVASTPPGTTPLLGDGQGSTPIAKDPNGGWNYPNIYQLIANAGESVVAQNVIVVNANNPYFTPTDLNVAAGDEVWIDLQASGQWSTGTGYPTTNADGNPNAQVIPGINSGALVGKIGSGTDFYLGESQWNMAPPGSGPLFVGNFDVQSTTSPTVPGTIVNGTSSWGPSLPGQPIAPAASNYYDDDTGQVVVRVIITH